MFSKWLKRTSLDKSSFSPCLEAGILPELFSALFPVAAGQWQDFTLGCRFSLLPMAPFFQAGFSFQADNIHTRGRLQMGEAQPLALLGWKDALGGLVYD